ncbi:19829_t:CDS:2 [Entrophospora sp. SA101]|nr:19829_t:CDS:2 [Entrophospora sp. SA101]
MASAKCELTDLMVFLPPLKKVPVKFFKEVDGLGKLVGTDDSIAGAIIDLPFWIAKRLAKRQIVGIQRPKFLEDQIINALIANPIDVNLRIICPQFYTFATKYVEQQIVGIQRPKFLEDQIINALIANPIDVNLRIICPQFYTFATKYVEQANDARFAEKLRQTLLTSKLARNVEIWDRAKRFAEDHNEFLEKLDDDEQSLFHEQRERFEECYMEFC